MRRKIALLLSSIILITCSIPAEAETEERKYATMNVEFSDNIGSKESINVMTENNHVYANAKELADRLGYQVNDLDDKYISIYNYENENLPYGLTQFFYDDTKVKHMLFFRMVEEYKTPTKCIHDDRGVWVPLEYFLLILNSGMLIADHTLLIDMPEKKITDIFVDVMKEAGTYLFEWGKDFGYSDADVMISGSSSHIVNLFNGLLKVDGNSWIQLFQTLVLNPDSYDRKYGENIAMFLCTESAGELQALQKDIQKYQDMFSENGRIAKLLSLYSSGTDSKVDAMYETCSNILEDVKAGNSNMAVFNKSYEALERAVDKQIWFSKTGQQILDIQREISDVVSILDSMAKITEVFQYGEEFQNQDEFSINALEHYLKNSSGNSLMSRAMKASMTDYYEDLKSNLVEYSAKRYFEENVGEWIGDAVKSGKLIGSQANMALLVWDLASGYVPFLSNGLDSADSFELALYASVLQSDTFMNYQRYRDQIFSSDSQMTAGNMYQAARYCYLYLKSCYLTRNAALASLEGKQEKVKQKIQPLIEEQNNINNKIAEMLIMLKKATKSNDHLIYGFLPADNANYLREYANHSFNSFWKEVWQGSETEGRDLNIVNKETAIQIAREKYGEEFSYFCTQEFSYQGKEYFSVDVEYRVDNRHLTRLTQVLVAKDGSYAGEGSYYKGMVEFYE